MNEEYLWSKKGSDPEIEGLEELLSEYRYRSGERPVVLSKFSMEQNLGFRTRFAWLLGIATPSFALALVGFLLLTSNSTNELQVRSSQIVESRSNGENERPIEIPAIVLSGTTNPKAPGVHRKAAAKKVKTVYRSRKSQAERAGSMTAMRLTSEEKYAYDRLMLALSITGTKLRIVQETVDGTVGNDLVRKGK